MLQSDRLRRPGFRPRLSYSVGRCRLTASLYFRNRSQSTAGTGSLRPRRLAFKTSYCNRTTRGSSLFAFLPDIETPVTFSQSIHSKQWHDWEKGLAADDLILDHLDKHRDKREVQRLPTRLPKLLFPKALVST
jgi:hypothetical protein